MPTIAVSDQPLQFASASGMNLFCLQGRMVTFAFSVGAVALGTFGRVDFFTGSYGFRTGGDRIRAGTIATWHLLLPIAHGQDSRGKKGSHDNGSIESQRFSGQRLNFLHG